MDQSTTSVDIFDRSFGKASRPPTYYNLDVIISVGYSVSVTAIMKSINVFHRVFYSNQELASKATVPTRTDIYMPLPAIPNRICKQGVCIYNRSLVREMSLIPSHIIDESMSRFLQTVFSLRGLLQLQQAR